jgi:deazaflavin-dependent oxidoreductase (nitroreductase family)
VTSGGNDIIEALGKVTRVGTFDITTRGRKTGQPRRLEIVYHVIDGRLYISGVPSPRRRSWLANLDADPSLTLHLRRPVARDVAAKARIIDTEAERRAVLPRIASNWRRDDIERMVLQSPLIEVSIEPAD